MRLVIATPLSIVVDEDDVVSVTAEDASGRFGILPRHADLLTVLEISVLTWRAGTGRRHCAVRGGVLTVNAGQEVAVSTREAVVGEVDRLAETVLQRFIVEEDSERSESADVARHHLALIRQIVETLGPRSGAGAP